MIKLVEGAERQKTPNEIALNILLVGLTIIFVFATATIPSYAAYAGGAISVVVLVALFVTLIPTTIGALLSAIGIAGMDRLVRFNVLAMSGRAVEAAGDVDTLLLDKTGTVTFGNRLATEIIPVPGVTEREAAEAALLASDADETAEGRSIITLMQEKYNVRRQVDAGRREVHRVFGDDAAVWRRYRRPQAAQGRDRFGARIRARAGRPAMSPSRRHSAQRSTRSRARAARRSGSSKAAASSASSISRTS